MSPSYWDDAHNDPGPATKALLPGGRAGPVSAFESDSVAVHLRIAVALSAKRRVQKPFDYVLVEEDDLAALGIDKAKTPGGTYLPDINDRHFDLMLDEPKARGLVERIAARMNPNMPPRVQPNLIKQLAREIQDRESAPLPANSWLLA